MLGWLIRGYLLDRLLRALSRQASGGGYRTAPRRGGPPVRYPYRPPRGSYGYGRPRVVPRRGRGGFFGPVPHYSTRTRRGTQVSVGGCCLPIPVGFLVGATGLLVRWARRPGRSG
jgi:hypothetical protein